MSRGNRCCSYPQGDGLILPQALMVFAVCCNMQMFGATDLLGYGTKDFLCVGYKLYTPPTGYALDSSYNYDYGYSNSSGSYRSLGTPDEVDAHFECKPLTLFNSMFWDVTDEQEGWHTAWQAAASLGAIGTAIGAVTLVVLLKSVCFEMKRSSIIVVASMQGLSALLSLFTLIAGAVDVCKYIKGADFSGTMACDKAGIHLETGSGFAIAASVFYLLALTFTLIFARQKSNFRLEGGKKHQVSNHSEEEVTGLVIGPEKKSHHRHSSKTKNNHNHQSVSILPDGRRQIERRYVDENGQVVTETTIEQPVPV